MADRSLAGLDWDAALRGPFHPSPSSWADQTLYFLLVDRFSDGQEDGCLDLDGARVPGTTPALASGDRESVLASEEQAAAWRAAGATWAGGSLAGIRSKLGYLKRLGVTALWISPVLRQRPGTSDYHGYGTQDFLAVDPHFGTEGQLRDLVRDAHGAGLYVILDVVLNHSGDVFGYAADRYEETDEAGNRWFDPRWDGRPYAVAGWRDEDGTPSLPFPQPIGPDRPGAGVWPAELQQAGSFTARGRISGWDHDPEYREGDFFGFKDINHGSGPLEDYVPSAALLNLTRAYQYWIAYADLDGFRVDTVKHMDPGATRFFTSAVHEFAQSIGKDRFFLVGEITGSRGFAVELMQQTGLDAALGLADVQGRLEGFVKGRTAPQEYFGLFRNSVLVGQGSHTWFRDHVVTSYDDHDQVRNGDRKARFAADDDGARLALAALAANATTLGIPCVYYGSEQAFDGAGGHDRYIREAMFGGPFGPFRSTGRHAFDETSGPYAGLAQVLAVRRAEPALRRGRQYLREISGDGVHFGFPQGFGGRIESIVAWSRILSGREVVCALNTDTARTVSAWVTVDAGLHAEGARFVHRYASGGALSGTEVEAEARNGLAIRLTLPPAGFAILVPIQPQ
ncbi:alpha-amylase family glycosyl hydrolase [Arthrobacter mobilis]|uniref:Alpha-amylase n=1 Tax=Arthrobacter mobilis TaxID=2724944 RepID=A0A7X6HC03_9MICC|nr:alpha-amylase family glycosyl hydrolase [Arthrobacter mobilis]NKX53343.1 alpha-amylase [Arthrobacter mobilis]